jgi:hypothetical protein
MQGDQEAEIHIFCATRTIVACLGNLRRKLRPNSTPQDLYAVLNQNFTEIESDEGDDQPNVEALRAVWSAEKQPEKEGDIDRANSFEEEKKEDDATPGNEEEKKEDDATPGNGMALPNEASLLLSFSGGDDIAKLPAILPSLGDCFDADTKEGILRNELLACDIEIEKLQARRRDMLHDLHALDGERAKKATLIKQVGDQNTRNTLATECPRRKSMHPKKQPVTYSRFRAKVASAEKGPSTPRGRRSTSRSFSETPRSNSSAASEVPFSPTDSSDTSLKRDQVCGECFMVFNGKYSRDLHCREVHKLFCEKCDRIFPSRRELLEHLESSDHPSSEGAN